MPAPRMIRCINGHVFDGGALEACPECGWSEKPKAADASTAPPGPTPPDRRGFLIAASGVVVAAAGAGAYAWLRTPEPPPPPPPPEPSPPKAVERQPEVAKTPEPTPPAKAPGPPIFTDLQPLRPDEQIAAAAALGLSPFATDTALLTRALRLSERKPLEVDLKRLLVNFVRAGQPLALTEAATASYFGYAVAINDPIALDFATRAANQGAVRGRGLLAQMLLAGRALPRDPVAAGDLLTLAARADSAGASQAMTGLAALKRSLEGAGPTATDANRASQAGNWDLAIKIARTLADAKIAAGYNIIGERYWLGVGLEKNVPLGIEWIQKAVAIGYPIASLNLSSIAKNPPGGRANFLESMAWLQIALLQTDDKPRASFVTEKISADAGLLDSSQWQAMKTLFAGLTLPGSR